MSTLLLVSFFLLGAISASFVGVVVARLYTGQSFFTGRSRCDACGRPLSALALVPVLSYVVSRGRAQCCGARLSLLSPLSEVILGLLFAVSYLQLGVSLSLLGFLICFGYVLALVLYDLAHQILPPVVLSQFVFFAAVTGFLASASLAMYMQTVVVALVLSGVLAVIHFGSRGRAMGLADAPFVLGLSLMVGEYALSGFVFSFWIGAVIGIGILLGRAPGSRIGVEVPFAPFLASGFLLAHLTQWNILHLIAGSL